ncbi:reverse transcriptase domain-containing protein [Tanacetum coccineum]
MAKFTYFKVKGKLTDSIFNEMLEFFQHVFPTTKGYKLPPSYYAIKKTFKTIGLGYESIHACVNDCFLFWGDNNKDVHFCPVCKTSRWKDSNTPGKKVSKKVLRYFLIIPRLQRLYKSSHTAKEMTCHATGKCMEPESPFMLTLLIPGPKSLGNDIDVYLRHLIDDLKVLWALKGVKTIDVATARSKTAYVGHRRFLKNPHKWRRSLEFNGEIEDGDPPRKFDRDQIQAQLARLPTRVKGKHPSYGGVKIKCNVHMSTDVARGHGGDGGGDDRPPSHHIPTGCGGCFANRGKGTRKANLGGRKAGRLHTRQETRNLGLKKITDDKGPVPIRFEWDDKKTMMPLGGHASHWSNYLGELIREMPLYYPSWQKVPAERKARSWTKYWSAASPKAVQLPKCFSQGQRHWVINPKTGTYDVETIRQGRPESITPADWDAQITFWNDPRNQARAAQNRQNRAKSTVVCRLGSRSLARLRDEMMASLETREYPSLIDTFFVTHTVNGVFIRDEDRAIYEEMVRLRALGSNTESGVPYTDEEINAMARKGKQRGHLPGVGRVLPGRARDVLIPPPPPPPQCTHNSGDVEKLKKKNKYLTKQVNLMMKLFRSDDKFSQMLTQYESTPEFGSGSGGCGDDEIADDEDGGEDEEDEEDGDS